MKRKMIVVLISAFFVTGCAIGFGRHGEGLVIVPALPATVELDADQHYYQNGYYYNYQGNAWLYSESREGPWLQLPRNRYPREVHYRNHDEHGHGDQHHNY
jgi:hypothetical protein